jgi:lipopolysaccharide biosynthesis glycosyltransferase
MLSVLLNCNEEKTFVVYHILCSPDFDELSINIYKSLFNNFSHNVEMIFYNMGNHFMKHKNTRWSQTTFYRILTPLFINEDRIIHLDGDTLTFSDLSEMYNLDFDDNYILGFYEIISNGLDYLGLNSTSYFNAGVTLFNLKKLREDNKTFELIELCNSDVELTEVDQTALNYLLYPKIGRLPSKYGIFNFEDESDLKLYYNLLRTKVPLNELEEALNNPGIIHLILCKPKPWFPNSNYMKEFTDCEQRHDCSCAKYFNLWHSIANLTDYYEEILNFTGVKFE